MTIQVGLRELYVNVKHGVKMRRCVTRLTRGCHIAIKLLVAVKYIHTNHIGYKYYIFTFLSI